MLRVLLVSGPLDRAAAVRLIRREARALARAAGCPCIDLPKGPLRKAVGIECFHRYGLAAAFIGSAPMVMVFGRNSARTYWDDDNNRLGAVILPPPMEDV